MKIVHLSLLLLSINGLQIEDMKNTNGVLHYTVNNVKVIDSYFETYHYYNLKSIINEINNLSNLIIKKPTSLNKLILHNIHTLKKQIETLTLVPKTKRVRRGLINGFGTAISWVTGNMDATDKEKYDRILQQLTLNNKQNNINELNLIRTNQQLINKYENNTKHITNNFKQISKIIKEKEDSYDLYIHTQLLENQISDLLLSMEFCKSGIIHSNLLADIIENIPDNVTLISNNSNIIWENTKIYCSFYNTTFHVFVKLPIHEKDYMGYLIIPIPINVNNSYKQLDINNQLVIKHNNKFMYGQCRLLDYYYCQTLKPINNLCIMNIIENANLNPCTYSLCETNLYFNEYLRVYFTIGIRKINTCKNDTIFLPDIAMVNVSTTDCVPIFNKTYKHNMHHVYKPLYVNLQLEDIEMLNITTPNFVAIPLIPYIPDNLLYATVCILLLLILGISYYVYHRKQQIIPTAPELYELTVQRQVTHEPTVRYQPFSKYYKAPGVASDLHPGGVK